LSQKSLGGTTIVRIGHHSLSQTTKKQLPEPLFSGTRRIISPKLLQKAIKSTLLSTPTAAKHNIYVYLRRTMIQVQSSNTSKYTILLANLGILHIITGVLFVNVKECDRSSHLTLVLQRCSNALCTMPIHSKEAVKQQKEEEVIAAAILQKRKGSSWEA
jgi:hypothetical protein